MRRFALVAISSFAAVACSTEAIAPQGPPGPRAVADAASAYDSDRGRLVIYGGRADHDGDPIPVSTTWEWDGEAWEQKNIPGPGPLTEHAMAYDPLRKKILLYGGLGGARSCERTWEYDGEAWEELFIDGARCRWRHTLAWDPQRRAVVLFGGITDELCTDGQCQETWSFDGVSWALIVLPPE